MVVSQFHKQVQGGISRWLRSGKKCGFLELDSEITALSSVLGKRSENQDRTIFLRIRFEESRKPAIAALVLCDGMGGMVSGGDCATLAISTFVTTLIHSTAPKLIEKLDVAVRDANQAVYSAFQGKGGATLSAVVCDETKEWAAINVGDSRIYSVFNKGTVEQLTVDDTLENQLADLNLPSPPPEFRQLLQYVGMGEGLEPRHIELRYSPEFRWLLITSDGAHNVPSDIFKALINNATKPRDVVFRLTELSEWLGGKDNATVAILDVGGDFFSRDEDIDSGSLEIWSIPGKIEFLSIKPSRVESLPNDSSKILDSSTFEAKQSPKREETQSQKKPKKKNGTLPKLESKVLDGDKNSARSKGEGDKPVPQLNIEFSEEH